MTPRRLATGTLVVLTLALLASVAPLLAYTTSLALFGLPHVFAEMRFVDGRFRSRIRRRLAIGLGVALLTLVAARVIHLGVDSDIWASQVIELVLLATLVVLTLPALAAAGPRRLVLGVVALSAIVFGIVTAPAGTLVLLAVLHNLTPIGFLGECVARRVRPQLWLICGLTFVLVPAVIVAGFPGRLFATWLPGLHDFGLFENVALQAQLGAFVPGDWQYQSIAPRLFAAAVYLQMLHYVVVLRILPRYLSDAEAAAGWLNWPSRRSFSRHLTLLGLGSLGAFALSFGDARVVYGVFAAVHAWIEIPVLLLITTWSSAQLSARPSLEGRP